MQSLHPLVRLLLGLIAGLIVVFLFDRFVFPGTLVDGAIGIVLGIAVLAFVNRKG